MTKTDIKTSTYNVGEGFFVDIVDLKEIYEIYLYHETIGVKELMFGLPKGSITFKNCIEIVERNLENENYIQNYIYDYMD